MTVVDSSVWADYLNGIPTRHTDRLDELLGLKPIAIGDLIPTKVLQGFRNDAFSTIGILLPFTEHLGMRSTHRPAKAKG